MDIRKRKKDIEGRAAEAGKAFERFRQAQVLGGTGSPEDLARRKAEVHKRLGTLRDELDDYLAGEYNVKKKDTAAFRLWRSQYQAFHWSVEFFGIMNTAKFDVVIGNPPYVEYTKKNKTTRKSVRDRYQIKGYRTEDCDDLYAFFLERCQELISTTGSFGMIVPVSIVSTDGFKPLRRIMLEPQATNWILNFAERPSKLFSGVEKRLTIWIAKYEKRDKRIFVSRYRRWFSEERNLASKDCDALFSRIEFTTFDDNSGLVADSIPKISTDLERSILRKLATQTTIGTRLARTGRDFIFYTRKLRYFVQFFDFIPKIHDAKGKLVDPSELKEVVPRNGKDKAALLCCLNSSLFFWFFTAFSDVRNINRREIEWFRFGLDDMSSECAGTLAKLSKRLMDDFNHHSRFLTNSYKKYGDLTIQSFQPRLSKPVIDEIDRAIAPHYQLSPEELDFIISFDYKYRMGQDDEEAIGDEDVDAATAD